MIQQPFYVSIDDYESLANGSLYAVTSKHMTSILTKADLGKTQGWSSKSDQSFTVKVAIYHIVSMLQVEFLADPILL